MNDSLRAQTFKKCLDEFIGMTRLYNGGYRFDFLPPQPSVSYKDAELVAFDQRLLVFLREVHRDMWLDTLRTCWAYWNEPALPRGSYGSGPHATPMAVQNIESVLQTDSQNKTCLCTFSSYELHTLSDGTECSLHYYRALTSTLPFSWLEQYYPGAVGRLLAAQDLGLTADETAYYAFHYVGNEQHVMLPNTLMLDE